MRACVLLRITRPDLGRAARRARVRGMLARHLGCLPADVGLAHDDGGRPWLPATRGRQVSVSYAEGCIAVAVARRPVGVDVERLRPLEDWRAIASDHLAPLEAARLDALGDALAPVATLRLLTLKEAVAKLAGTGVADGLPPLALPPDALRGDGGWTLPTPAGPARLRSSTIPLPAGSVLLATAHLTQSTRRNQT